MFYWAPEPNAHAANDQALLLCHGSLCFRESQQRKPQMPAAWQAVRKQ